MSRHHKAINVRSRYVALQEKRTASLSVESYILDKTCVLDTVVYQEARYSPHL